MNNIFRQLHLYTLLMEGMNTILIDQMSTHVVLKKYILWWHNHFQQFTT